jgi:hypothetical protein
MEYHRTCPQDVLNLPSPLGKQRDSTIDNFGGFLTLKPLLYTPATKRVCKPPASVCHAWCGIDANVLKA